MRYRVKWQPGRLRALAVEIEPFGIELDTTAHQDSFDTDEVEVMADQLAADFGKPRSYWRRVLTAGGRV